MTRRAARTGWLLLLMGIPTAVTAQGRTCDLVQPTDYRQIVDARGDEIVYFRGPVRLECEGAVRLASDSAIYNRGQLQIELIGDVSYRDSTRHFTSDWANYIGRLEQLIARGAVVVTDLMDGSVVTGEEMDYLRETADRPTSRVIMRGGRPRAVLREGEPVPTLEGPAPALPPPSEDTVPPLEITADRLESYADSLFHARGTVDIVRGDMTGAADSATYRRFAEHLSLLGGAHVQDEQFRLEGEALDAFVRGEVLEEVMAVGAARLVSEELTVRSVHLRIAFEDGEVDRMEAWNPAARATARATAAREPEADTTDADAAQSEPADADRTIMDALVGAAGERAVATAEGFELRADSIDAQTDAGQLREIRAVGRAYGERPLDSLAVDLPVVLARDWIQGDTILSYFRVDTLMTEGVQPDSVLPTETPGPERPVAGGSADSTQTVLERMVVIGGRDPALSLYRMGTEAEGDRPAINFMSARRIILYLTEGDVSLVEAEGPMEGLHLDPETGAPVDDVGGGGS